MSLRDKIQIELTAAMKAKNEARVATLRLLWSAIKNEEINNRADGTPAGISDLQAQAVAARLAKQYTDALADFTKAGRSDLIEKTTGEIAVLKEFLPAEMSESDLAAAVEKAIAETGAVGPTDVGKVMGMAMKAVAGRADGNRVRAAVVKMLES